MKKSLIILLGLLFLSVCSIAQTKEQEAIKKVCIEETDAYKKFEYDRWASYHLQTEDEQLSWNNPDGSFGIQTGWKEISEGMKDWFKTATKENSTNRSDNFKFIIHGDIALVSYDTVYKTADGKQKKMHDYKTLRNIKGEWKIITVHNYTDYTSIK